MGFQRLSSERVVGYNLFISLKLYGERVVGCNLFNLFIRIRSICRVQSWRGLLFSRICLVSGCYGGSGDFLFLVANSLHQISESICRCLGFVFLEIW